MVANDYDRRVLRRRGLLEAQEERHHRNVLGAIQRANRQFVVFANVDQMHRVARVELRLDVFGGDFGHTLGIVVRVGTD